eukprot:scpid103012/ scgid31756/ 
MYTISVRPATMLRWLCKLWSFPAGLRHLLLLVGLCQLLFTVSACAADTDETAPSRQHSLSDDIVHGIVLATTTINFALAMKPLRIFVRGRFVARFLPSLLFAAVGCAAILFYSSDVLLYQFIYLVLNLLIYCLGHVA